MLNIAIRAARQAGDILAKNYGIPIELNQGTSRCINPMLNDIQDAEKSIVSTIQRYYPNHSILYSDNSKSIESSNVQWIIDPLNGITNFTKKLSYFCISIAIRVKGRIELSVIHDPIRNEIFTGIRGQGAKLDSYRLRGSKVRNINGITMATALHSKCKSDVSLYLSILEKLVGNAVNLRSTGSSTLNLAYLAAGRVDGLFEVGLNPHELAAGELIVRESGNLITDFSGGHNYSNSGHVLAGKTSVVRSILTTAQSELKKIQAGSMGN